MTQEEQDVAREAIIQAEVDRSVKPYIGKAPPVVLAKLRELSERWFREHPQAVQILDMMVRNQQLRSGDVVKGSLDLDAGAAATDDVDAAGKV